MRRRLVIMLKEPRPGRVKTRLAQGLGYVGAAWWFRWQVRELLRRVRDPRWEVVLAVSPDREGCLSRAWPAEFARSPQGQGDLGDRMGRQLRAAGAGPVCVIGADVPGITHERIAEAFKALGSHDAVFGPAMDGGYWLIGLKRMRAVPPAVFEGVRWSTEHALADTIKTLPDHRIAFVQSLRDVDTIDDLAMTSPEGRVSDGP